MKGKTRIELTDINTGQVEVVESDNMITNALAMMITPYGNIKPPYGDKEIEEIIQGIYLFESPLEENLDNVNLLRIENNNLVGKSGKNTYSGADSQRGSYNEAESSLTGSEYKLVYDFDATKANGTISSISLTTDGSYGLGCPTTAEYPSNNIRDGGNININQQDTFPVMASVDEKYLYLGVPYEITGNSITMKKYLNAYLELGLGAQLPIEDLEIKLPEDFVADDPTIKNPIQYIFSSDGKGLIIGLGYSGLWLMGNQTGTFCILNNDFSTEVVQITNPTGNVKTDTIFNEKYIYSYSSNSSEIILYNRAEGTTEVVILPNKATRTLIGDYIVGYNYIFDLSTRKTRYGLSNMSNALFFINSLTMLQWNSSGSDYCRISDNMPIISINNLETPIVKDETKTMKVIYTLSIE